MINLYQKTWAEINIELAKRMVQLRKRKKISQKQSFTKLAIALGAEGELEALFKEVPFDSIEEILQGQTK